jgi:DNA polymerase III delta subunit
MLQIFYGPNSFAKKVELTKLKSQFVSENGQYSVKEISADEAEAKSFSENLVATGLFSPIELIILKKAEDNLDLIRIALESPDVNAKTIILLIDSLDKRTSEYKQIQKHPSFKEFQNLPEAKLKLWISQASKKLNIALDADVVQDLVIRTNSDQQEIWICLNQLALLQKEQIKLSDLDVFLPPSSSETAFNLLEASLRKNKSEFQKTLKELGLFREDPYRIIGLICSQGYSLAAVGLGTNLGKSPQAIASEVGIHPFVASQQAKLCKSLSLNKAKISQITSTLRWLDKSLKTINKTEPWPMIDAALTRIAVL